MSRRIYVKAVWKKEPEIRLYVLALLALARRLQEEEREAAGRAVAASPRAEEVADA